MDIFSKKIECSLYKINRKVLVRYGKKEREKAPKRRHVCIGKILKVRKFDMYKVGFGDLVNN